ncbi:hypothetical protein FB451DRAFT_1565990, partial [Mycena latifolia]
LAQCSTKSSPALSSSLSWHRPFLWAPGQPKSTAATTVISHAHPGGSAVPKTAETTASRGSCCAASPPSNLCVTETSSQGHWRHRACCSLCG